MKHSRVASNAFSRKGTLWTALYRQRYLFILLVPSFTYILIFKYAPMLGIQIAFKDFSFRKGIWDSQWAGLKYFQKMLMDITIQPAIVNTLAISTLKLVLGFPLPILFALFLNEVANKKLKKVIQTVSYFPHFISYSVVAVMLATLLAPSGVINSFFVSIGLLKSPYLFLGQKEAFWWIVAFTEVWKSTGWSSIIYFSALTAIPPELYEAAAIDGANRAQKMLLITLPCLKTTIIMLLILNIGSIVTGASFDLSYLLKNPLNTERAEILSTYILTKGIALGQFSFATALGLIQAVVSLTLVLTANFIVKKFSEEGVF